MRVIHFSEANKEMVDFGNSQIQAPTDWQAFERLCADLWREIWEDPHTQANGRIGQQQSGVDVFGKPKGGSTYAGVQCKGKDHRYGQKVTKEELLAECEKAKKFDPPLTSFILATTAPNDAKIQEIARVITEEHKRNGLFSVDVFGWEEIQSRLGKYPNLVNKHYPGMGTTAVETLELTNQIFTELRAEKEALESRHAELIMLLTASRNDPLQNDIIANSVTSNLLIEEGFPEIIKKLFDEGSQLVEEGRYADARQTFEVIKHTTDCQNCTAMRLKTHINIAQTQILEQYDMVSARDALLDCLREIPQDEQFTNIETRQMVLGLLGDAEILLGNVEEAKSLYQNAIQVIDKQQDCFAKGHHLIGLSHAEGLLGNLKDAHCLLDQATDLYRAKYRETVGEEKRRATTNLGASFSTKANLFRHEGKLTEAIACLTRAEPLFREVNSLDNLGRTLLFKAEILFHEANRKDGFDSLKEALSTFESIGNTVWQCRCFNDMANFFFFEHEEAAALACLERALHLVDSERSEFELVPYLLKLSHLCRSYDQSEKAMAFIEQAEVIATKSCNDEMIAKCFVVEAQILEGSEAQAARETLFRSATNHLKAALAKCEVKGRRAGYMQEIGAVYGWLHNVHEARRWFKLALQEYEEIGDVLGMGATLASLSAAAHEEQSPTDVIKMLERLIRFSEGKPLHYYRAGALHDLGILKLSQGDVSGARGCLEAAKAIAEKHHFGGVIDLLQMSMERLRNAEQFYQPQRCNFPDLIQELHKWCRIYPKFRNSILPLWYFLHRVELWSICRSMLAVKFLVCGCGPAAFRRLADALGRQGDFYVWGITFELKTKLQTELIPFPMEFLIPPHLKLVVLNREPSDFEELKRLLINLLRDKPYVLLPFKEKMKAPMPTGTELFVYGRHIRLAPMITKMMLDTPEKDLIATNRICLPTGEDKTSPGLMNIMCTAWENGLIPVLSGRLPHSNKIESVCDVFVNLPSDDAKNDTESTFLQAKYLWTKLLLPCKEGQQRSLSEFSAAMKILVGEHTSHSVIRARVYLLRFQAGTQEVVHPAMVVA